MPLLIHRIHSGPYEDEEGKLYLVCKAEENGILIDVEVFFENFEDVYTFKSRFLSSIEPILLTSENERM